MKNFVQHGLTVTLAAPAAVTSGSGVLVGAIFGVAMPSSFASAAMRRFLGVLRQRARGSAPDSDSGSAGTIVVRIPARPFLRPALIRGAAGVVGALQAEVAKRVRKALKK